MVPQISKMVLFLFFHNSCIFYRPVLFIFFYNFLYGSHRTWCPFPFIPFQEPSCVEKTTRSQTQALLLCKYHCSTTFLQTSNLTNPLSVPTSVTDPASVYPSYLLDKLQLAGNAIQLSTLLFANVSVNLNFPWHHVHMPTSELSCCLSCCYPWILIFPQMCPVCTLIMVCRLIGTGPFCCVFVWINSTG